MSINTSTTIVEPRVFPKTTPGYIPKRTPQLDNDYSPSPLEQGIQKLTTDQGVFIYDNAGSLKVGATGPVLLQDHVLREKIMHFDQERIPERVVHARGSAAYGSFTSYGVLEPYSGHGTFANQPIDTITFARFLQGKQTTETFTRFSQVLGSKGSADTVRDVRGFATKFYTEHGNYDLVGINMPLFFIQDAIKFPDLIHAAKQEPDSGFPQASTAHNNFWDWVVQNPESTAMLFWLYSDVGVVASYRHMEGSSSNTYTFVNECGDIFYVMLSWKQKKPMYAFTWDNCQRVAGTDPDYLRRDLWDNIKEGNHPTWTLCVQVIPSDEVDNYEFDPRDATKVWDEERFPYYAIGELKLTRNPSNHFDEVEQAAFHPGHVVPGIGVSSDPLLQGRLFSYLDTQLSRLGVNFSQLPVNKPIADVHNNHRQGKAQHLVHRGPTNYDPNSISGGSPASFKKMHPGVRQEPSVGADGDYTRALPDKWSDYFTQSKRRVEAMTPEQRERLLETFVFELGPVDKEIQKRVVHRIGQVSRDLSLKISRRL